MNRHGRRVAALTPQSIRAGIQARWGKPAPVRAKRHRALGA